MRHVLVLVVVLALRLRAGPRCGITGLQWLALWHHADLLVRIRLTRTAAERGPVLSGACGQVIGFHTVHPRVLRVRAPAVSTGSSVSGV